jgi:hypothetical protein
MIHYLYLGHFDHEGSFIRFEKRADSKPAWYRPVVHAALDPAVIRELLAEKGLTPSTVPGNWGLSFEEGFVACDRDTRNGDARDFVKRLAVRTGCDVADYSSLSLLSPNELWQTNLSADVHQANDRHRKDSISPARPDEEPAASVSKTTRRRQPAKRRKASR